jgi:hypothetical protein
MSDEEGDAADEEAEEPTVELGDGADVEGAPLARVASRLTWGIEQSTVREREGDAVIRTPDGPEALNDLLDDVDVPYFAHRREFESAVRDVLGEGPVPTAEE